MVISVSKRIKFFLSHLAISVIIVLIASSIIFLVWYSEPLAIAVGVMSIVLMMLAIDVVIGPLFTLLVYKEGKKTLKFDLSIIVLIQLSAFLYGFYSIEQGRPAWIVFNVDNFELVRKNEIVNQNINQIKPQFKQPSWLKPRIVATEFSENIQQRNDDMFAEVFGGISLAQRPERYVNFAKAKKQIQEHALPLKDLEKYNEITKVQKTLIDYPKANAFLPLKANVVDMVVLINKEQAEVVKIVDLRPWN